MLTRDRYEAVGRLALQQRTAGVDRDMADVIKAYARLRTNAGKSIDFYESEPPRSAARSILVNWYKKRNPTADLRLVQFLYRYALEMVRQKLPVIYSVRHFARKLRISHKRLFWMSRHQDQLYSVFSIPKRDGSARTISAPLSNLESVQTWILRRVLDRVQPHECATAFRADYSVVDNARPHVDRSVVINMDLKDFFPSITFRQVRMVFESLGYPYGVACVMANVCTLDGRLPQGAPTSPSLSNLVCRRLDKRLHGLSKSLAFSYTRYADDLTFSSDRGDLSSLIPLFRQILVEEGFIVNEEKVHIAHRGQRQQVTGIVVNKTLTLPRSHIRKLRSAMHRLKTSGPQAVSLKSRHNREADPENVLQGHLSYLRMVAPQKLTRVT